MASAHDRAPIAVAKRAREASAILLIAVAGYFILSLLAYDVNDPSWANAQDSSVVNNWGGIVGAWLAYTLYFAFGYIALVLSLFAIGSAVFIIRHANRPGLMADVLVQWVGYLLVVIALCGLAALHFDPANVPASAGGWLGQATAHGFSLAFGVVGASLLLMALAAGSFHLITSFSWLRIIDRTGAIVCHSSAFIREYIQQRKENRAGRMQSQQRSSSINVRRDRLKLEERKPPKIEPPQETVEESKKLRHRQQKALFASSGQTDMYSLPAISLLGELKQEKQQMSTAALNSLARQLEIKLADFGVEASTEGAIPGPVITRFEILPVPGTKANKITRLESDLARALSVSNVRVVEVIPGKPFVGIEIPNEHRELVSLREVLGSQEFNDKEKSLLAFSLGKDISGQPMVADLEKMPHLLIAGTTGAGKSVAVHTMLLSFLFRAKPDEVKLILIDAKMLELNLYEGIPHLLAPVVTDMELAFKTLRWAVAEMERRYRLMSALSVRNLAGYNKKIKQAQKNGETVADPMWQAPSDTTETASAPPLKTMPFIVVFIDEFADLMYATGRKVESLVVRLAQKARAAGIHLVLATQRPSVDVITGLIKANVPSRIAFQVSSKIDSRTIIDQNGAEQLLGKGDMLFLPAGAMVPERVHGAFVSDEDVRRVADELRSYNMATEFIDIQSISESEEHDKPAAMPSTEDGEDDPLYQQARTIVLESRKTSVSYLQRRLQIGYNRGARLIERLEKEGLISPMTANGKREVLAPPPADQA